MILEYSNSQFHECVAPKENSISLKIDDSQKKLTLMIPSTASMIEKRSAERNARGISKAGFLSNAGVTLGRGYELIVEGSGGALPDRLTHSPREVY